MDGCVLPCWCLHMHVDHSSTYSTAPNHSSPRLCGSQVGMVESGGGVLGHAVALVGMSNGCYLDWKVYEDHQVRKAWAVSALSDI
jgi:hypothetical protein